MRKVAVVTASALGVIFLVNAGPRPPKAPAQPPVHFTRGEPTLLPHAPAALGLRLNPGPVSLSLPVPPEPAPPPPPPPTPREALRDGVLIVVSLASQRAFVFKDGHVWDSTQVSTGKTGKETPAGVFPILQKKVDHRSTLYDDAPMPYMQRLTWDGVALHAGRVPGYPASHGCIRLPEAFAKKLYGITGFSSTIVVVTDEAVTSAKEARALA